MADPTLEQIQQEAFYVQAMIDTPGWKMLAIEAEATKAAMLDKLIFSSNIDEIRDFQAQARAMKFLLAFPKMVQDRAKEASEAVDELSSQHPQEAPEA